MGKLNPMVDMELDDEDKLDAAMPIPMPAKPDYPYGLRICLTEKELEKLDLDHSEAFYGGTVHGHFMGRITNIDAGEGENGPRCRIEIQIERLAIESEDDEE